MNSLTESSLRHRAKKLGLKLQKSRSRNQAWPGYGTYRVLQFDSNLVVFGGSHDTYGESLADCAQFINTRIAQINK